LKLWPSIRILSITMRLWSRNGRNILDGLAVRGGDAKKIAQNEVHVRLRELEMI
jgi:hypothetical protein